FSLSGEIVRLEGAVQRHGGTISLNSKGFGMFITPLLLITFAWLLASGRGVSLRVGLVVVMGTAALILMFTRASWSGFVFGMLWIILLGQFRRIRHPDPVPGVRGNSPSGMPIAQRRLVPLTRVAVLPLLAMIPLLLLWPKIQVRLGR